MDERDGKPADTMPTELGDKLSIVGSGGAFDALDLKPDEQKAKADKALTELLARADRARFVGVQVWALEGQKGYLVGKIAEVEPDGRVRFEEPNEDRGLSQTLTYYVERGWLALPSRVLSTEWSKGEVDRGVETEAVLMHALGYKAPPFPPQPDW